MLTGNNNLTPRQYN